MKHREIAYAFSGKLPAAMVMPFAYAIPFCEVTAGSLILLGLCTRIGLTISGLLLIGLTFGTVILGQGAIVARNLHALVNFVLFWFVDMNRYSLDSLFWRPAVPEFTT